VSLHFPESSGAAVRAELQLHRADHAVRVLRDLVRPRPDGDRLEMVLLDPEAEAGAGAGIEPAEPEAEVTAFSAAPWLPVLPPGAPAGLLARIVTHALLPRWFGPRLAGAGFLLDGIAGLVAAKAGSVAVLEEADGWVRAELERGRRPRLGSWAAAAEPAQSGPADPARALAATSFAGHLLRLKGPQGLRRLLAALQLGRQDEAARVVYRRPLAALEESWLESVGRRGRRAVAAGAILFQLLPLLRPFWLRELEILAYMLVGLGLGLALPLSTRYLVDQVIPAHDPGLLALFVAVLAGVYLLDPAIGLRRAYVTTRVNQRILLSLQERMFAHLQRLPHAFYSEAKVGDLMSRLTGDVQVVQGALSQVTTVGVFLGLRAVVTAVTVLALSPLLGALLVLVVPIFGVTYLVLRRRLNHASLQLQKLAGASAAAAQENLSAHAVVKALGLEERSIRTYRQRLVDQLRWQLRLTVTAGLFESSVGVATTVGQLVVLGAGGYLVMTGSLTVGTLLAFAALLAALFQPIVMLSNLGQTIQRASGALTRVRELLDEPVRISSPPGAIEVTGPSRAIRLEKVTFGYTPGHPVLEDLDLAIPARSEVAIVGRSGSGKSTIASLLLRFWDPDSGRVTFDGHDLRELSLESLRSRVGIVFQDTFVFDASVRENIALARPGAGDAEVRWAAQQARLEEFVTRLPNGYDTVLGERGVKMSGGQRQRLAIARALLRRPQVLVLDEATSALDAQTEREIVDTLESVKAGRTTITITHRLGLAARADLIVVIEGGRVIEQGSHVELLRAGGVYRRLHREQGNTELGPAAVPAPHAGLERIPIFRSIGPASLRAVAQRLRAAEYRPGDLVVQQGEEGDRLYVVGEGQLEVLVWDGRDWQRVNVLQEGDYFGEMALLTGQPRMATVRALTPCELLSMDRDDFARLAAQEPELARAVANTLAARRAALTARGLIPHVNEEEEIAS
jgi:ATP-binding cassette subfamily B protein